MPGVISLSFDIVKGGMKSISKSPIFIPGPVEPQFGPGRYIYFEGFSVDEHGKQHYMDATVAYRQASLNAIEYLKRFGYSDYQAYLLLGCAPIQGHVAGIVDVRCSLGYTAAVHALLIIMQIPNACTTLGVPIDIFDFDIFPTAKVEQNDMGACAHASS
jgi:formamidase